MSGIYHTEIEAKDLGAQEEAPQGCSDESGWGG